MNFDLEKNIWKISFAKETEGSAFHKWIKEQTFKNIKIDATIEYENVYVSLKSRFQKSM